MKRLCDVLLFVVVCAVVLGFTSAAAEEEGLGDLSPAELREFFLAGYTALDEHFEDIDIAIRLVQKHDPEWRRSVGLDPNKEISEVVTRYAAKGDKERNWFYESPQAFEEGKSRSTTISDGVYVLYYDDTKGTKDTETQRGRAALAYAGDVSLRRGPHEPGRIIGDYAGYSVKDILSSPNLEINPEPQEIDGMECYEVSAPVEINRVTYQVHYWLCPDRSSLPVRFELWDAGFKKKSREFSEFEKLPDGGWFPKKFIHHSYLAKEGTPWEIGLHTFTIERMELAPELDEDTVFDTSPKQLPVGCLFQDQIAGAEYVIGEGPVGEEHIEKLLEDIASGFPEVIERVNSTKQLASVKLPAETKPPGEPSSEQTEPTTPTVPATTTSPILWPYTALGLAVILVVGGLIVLLIKRRRATDR